MTYKPPNLEMQMSADEAGNLVNRYWVNGQPATQQQYELEVAKSAEWSLEAQQAAMQAMTNPNAAAELAEREEKVEAARLEAIGQLVSAGVSEEAAITIVRGAQ